MNPEFPILVFQKKNQFYCTIKDLGIIESSDTLSEAYERAQKKKSQVLAQFKAADLEGLIQKRSSEEPKKKRSAVISLNFACLCLLLMIPVMALTQPLSMILSRLSHLFQLSPMQLVLKVNERLEHMSVEEKKNLRHAIHNLIGEAEQLAEAPSKESLI